LIHTSTSINTKQVTNVSDWTKPASDDLKKMQSYPPCSEAPGTSSLAGTTQRNPAGASCFKNYPKKLEELSWDLGKAKTFTLQ